MMKYTYLITIAVLLYSTSFAQPSVTDKVQRPKLVVGIVVDQMSWDYLYKYYP